MPRNMVGEWKRAQVADMHGVELSVRAIEEETVSYQYGLHLGTPKITPCKSDEDLIFVLIYRGMI